MTTHSLKLLTAQLSPSLTLQELPLLLPGSPFYVPALLFPPTGSCSLPTPSPPRSPQLLPLSTAFSSSLSLPQSISPSILFLLASSLSWHAKVCSNLPSVAINVPLIEHDSCFVFTATTLVIANKKIIAQVALIVMILESRKSSKNRILWLNLLTKD